MYLPLDGDSIYVIEGEIPPSPFFRAVRNLVPDGAVMSILAYTEDAAFTAVLDRHCGKIVGRQDFGRDLAIWKDEYPTSRQFDLLVTSAALSEIAAFLESNTRETPFCDHIFIYEGDRVLISFHDSFSGGEIHLSRTLEDFAVKAATAQMGATLKCMANPCA